MIDFFSSGIIQVSAGFGDDTFCGGGAAVGLGYGPPYTTYSNTFNYVSCKSIIPFIHLFIWHNSNWLIDSLLCIGTCNLCMLIDPNCQPGSYALLGSQCTNCSAGTYSTGIGATVCSACSPGSYQSSSGSTYCITCSAGTYSTVSSPQCTPCQVSTNYVNAYVANDMCVPLLSLSLSLSLSVCVCVCVSYCYGNGILSHITGWIIF
jgi:hypothetical protein